MKTQKLIEEYKIKVSRLDNLIESILLEFKIIRRNGTSAMTIEEWTNVKKVADAQRQCYIQFIEDLKTI
jgi:hypothetical protein|tara:strand:- start:4157 stop:4363 length:207 start_codon:yes stop_codon:yes gene_type:complete